jgi:hypothetical protein
MPSPRFSVFRHFAGVLLVGALFACAGDGATDPGVPPAPGPAPVPNPVAPAEQGAVLLEVSGVPDGAEPVLRLQSGGLTRVLRTGGRVDSLPLGVYELRVDSIAHEGDVWDPTPSRLSLTVRAASPPTVAAVAFNRRGPRVIVRAFGLPAYARGPVRVTGPGSFSRTVLTGDTLRDLTPGAYQFSADEVETTDGRFEALPSTVTVTVPSNGTQEAPFTYVSAMAALTVQTSGLPGGSVAGILVNGPGGFTERVDSTATIRGIPPGVYVATAARVQSSGFSFAPDATTRDIAITGTSRRTIAFNYTIVTGALAIAVSGLPPGAAGMVEVTGPSAFQRTIEGTTTLTDLTPGPYRVTVRPVSYDNVEYGGQSATIDVTVEASLVATPAIVRYVGAVGALDLEVLGLPPELRADIRLQRADGPVLTADASQSFTFLPPGTYAVEARPVQGDGFTWTATDPVQHIVVAAQARPAVTVRYVSGTGTLSLAIGGLPAGTNAAVRVRGPFGFDEAVSATRTLGALAPGTYHITALPLAVGPTLFTPTPDSLTVLVQASATVAKAITYAPAGTSLNLSITGLPTGVDAKVQVAGPAGFSTIVDGNRVLPQLTPGTYVVSALEVAGPSYRYAGTPVSQTVSLSTGQQASVSVVYAASTGRLTLLATGLPAGAAAPITLSGPSSKSVSVQGETTVADLIAGAWTITAAPTTVGGVNYEASPAALAVTVLAGQVVSRTVQYRIAESAPGANLVLQRAQITQAIQDPSGSVPLVAGREALLRVFVTAASANTLTPPVRVRLFEGTTLFRTVTIDAPGAGVPTTEDESALQSTWNVLLTASDMRPDLRVRVDVDPNNQVAEPDETDNVWPRAGTHPVDVRAVPPFSVVFVPVHQSVNGSTGNVTAGNVDDAFLKTTRRIFPLGVIGASVRTAYTTNAAALQPDDGNGAWLTVLSEMQALRVADGSTAHYYGVVSPSYSSGVAGYAFVPGRAALGWDKTNSSDRVAAHELGHTFGRQHVAACGPAGGTDSNYPYAGGEIGNIGWNAGTGALVSRSTTDIMGYCSNQWISDYTWKAVLNHRGTSSGMIAAFASAPRTTLLVWGRVHRGVVTLEPAVRLVTRAALPERSGRYRVELRDADGRAMFGAAFEPDAIDHDNEAFAFSFAIPLDAFTEARLASVVVTGGRNGTVEQSASAAMSARSIAGGDVGAQRSADGGAVQVSDPQAVLSTSGRLRQLRWDDGAWPMAMVRDAESGRVLAWLRRSGDGFLPAGARVRVVFTNGIHSLTQLLDTP